MSGPIVRWYVPRYGGAPTRREFVRETDGFLISSRNGRESREAKHSNYYSFYASEDAALAAVASIKAAKEEKERERRVRDAAPELLAALIQVEELLEDGHWSNTKRVLRELIAKAAGEGA